MASGYHDEQLFKSHLPIFINKEQNPNISKNKESYRGIEGGRNASENKAASYTPQHIFSATLIKTVESDLGLEVRRAETEESGRGSEASQAKNEEGDGGLEVRQAGNEESNPVLEPEVSMSVGDTDMETFYVPHFLSQTENDPNEGSDVNRVVGASADKLYTQTHTYSTGRKRIEYSCNVCEKEFTQKRQCMRHIRVHTGEKPFTCNECGESFVSDSNLNRHIQTHTGEKPFSCDICNKDFAQKSTLDQHLLNHTDMSERPFQCIQCDKGFVKKSHLDRHVKTHSKYRAFLCITCGKGFNEKRHLLDHTKRLHSDRVLPSCKICNREFRWDHLLIKHMEVHESDEKLFKDNLPMFINNGGK